MSSGKQAENKESQSSRKNAGTRDKEPVIRCPRCDSPNTKFCYYNNYSLSQPRHFCKTCRRYWTKGGALRNVPVGGGCRKSKKLKCDPSTDVRFFAPAISFQPRGLCNQFSQESFNMDPYCAGTSSATLMGVGFPLSSSAYKPAEGTNATGFQEMGSNQTPIESLSYINPDLHWKLQQQRISNNQPAMFQNLQISNSKQAHRKGSTSSIENLSTEWFFGNTAPTSASNSTSNITNWSTFP